MDERSDLFGTASEAAVSALSLSAGQAVAYVIAGLSSIVLARVLGPEGYGKYSLSTVVALLFTLLIDFGVSAALTQEVSRLRGSGAEAPMVKLALRFALAVSLLAAAAGALASDALTLLLLQRPELVPLTRLAIPLVVFNALFTLSSSALLGMGDARALALLPVVRDLSRSLLSPLLAVPLGCVGAVAGLVTGHGLAAAAGVALALRRARGPAAEWQRLRPLLSYGLPLYASTAVSTLLGVYQNAVVAWVATDEEVGNLRVSGNFLALLQLLSAPLAMSLFPAFSRLGAAGAVKAFPYAVRYSALLLAPAGAYAIAASHDLVRAIYGGAYRLASPYLSLQAVSFLWVALGAGGSFLQGIGETRANLRVALTYATAFTPLSLFLAPHLGVYGFILATLASSLLSTAYTVYEVSRRGASVEWKRFVSIAVAALAAAAPAAAVSLLRVHYAVRLAASAAAYLLAYSLALPVVNGIDRSDLESLHSILQRTPLKPVAELVARYEAQAIELAEALARRRASGDSPSGHAPPRRA